jgi:hypothetical protein
MNITTIDCLKEEIKMSAIVRQSYRKNIDPDDFGRGYTLTYFNQYYAPACDTKNQETVAGDFLFDENEKSPLQNITHRERAWMGVGATVLLTSCFNYNRIARRFGKGLGEMKNHPLRVVGIRDSGGPWTTLTDGCTTVEVGPSSCAVFQALEF